VEILSSVIHSENNFEAPTYCATLHMHMIPNDLVVFILKYLLGTVWSGGLQGSGDSHGEFLRRLVFVPKNGFPTTFMHELKTLCSLKHTRPNPLAPYCLFLALLVLKLGG
jgi:hypothetical protein